MRMTMQEKSDTYISAACTTIIFPFILFTAGIWHAASIGKNTQNLGTFFVGKKNLENFNSEILVLSEHSK